MDKKTKAKHIALIVFHGIWIIAAAVLWINGLIYFLEDKNFGNWMIWGILCAIVIIVPILRGIIDSAKQGARDGANEYSATWIGNTLHVENHPFRGAVFGAIVGLLGGLLVGPILVPLYFIISVCKVITSALALKRGY